MSLSYSTRTCSASATDAAVLGVGEATIPPIREFNRLAGIDEVEFMKATDATFKVGIEFENWGALGDRYLHAFGHVGQELDAMVRLHHWWLLGKQAGGSDYPVNLLKKAGR